MRDPTRSGRRRYSFPTRAERGPLWFAEPRTAILGAIPDPAAPAAARGIVEGVLFADRMVIEACIEEQQRTLYVSGAFGSNLNSPHLLSDVLDRDILVVDESHLPAIGAAAMCVAVLAGHSVNPPRARLVQPRPQWRDTRGRSLAALPAGLVHRHRNTATVHA